jgi:hypothetical protein
MINTRNLAHRRLTRPRVPYNNRFAPTLSLLKVVGLVGCAVLRRPLCNPLADPARYAGDQGNFAGEFFRHWVH